MKSPVNKPEVNGATWKGPAPVSARSIVQSRAMSPAISQAAPKAAQIVVAAREVIISKAAAQATRYVAPASSSESSNRVSNASRQASQLVTGGAMLPRPRSLPSSGQGGIAIPPGLVDPIKGVVSREPDPADYTQITADAYGGSNVYGGPSNVEPDRAYVPPPRVEDLPGQYADYMDMKPAITNSTSAMALKKDSASLALGPKPLQASNVKTSLIDRILGWLGLSRTTIAHAQMAGEAAGMAIQSRTETAFSLVRRVRNGDQNAMATMAAVRDAALKGNKQAEVSLRLMKEYIKAHPNDENGPTMGSEFGGDGEEVQNVRATVALFHGPQLSNSRVATLIAHLTPYQKDAVAHGMKGGNIKEGQPVHVERAHRLGKVIAAARNLQAQRAGKIGRVNSDIGWELDD